MIAQDTEAADFAPLAAARADVPVPAAPSPTQRLVRRFLRNPRGIASLLIITALALLTLLGPRLWPLDPARQQLDAISLPPGAGERAQLVSDTAPRTLATAGGTSPLRIAHPAFTTGVQLAWTPVADAHGYAVYRHELRPGGVRDLGLPLAVLEDETGYQDHLGLQPRRYYYSVAVLDARGDERLLATASVRVHRALTPAAAAARGLVPDADGTVTLAAHPLGTDYLGRDLLARSIHGARTSLFIGIVAPLLFVAFGTLWGALAGFRGGLLDEVLMRIADFVVALPFLLFMILLKVSFGIGPGESGVMPMLAALLLLGWPGTARLVRGEVLRLREAPYIQSARLLGASTPYLLLRHVLPNLGGLLLVTLSFAIPSAIFTEAFLSFIGLGVAPPAPSWGAMCNDGLRTLLTDPHELLVPAGFISITVLAFNFLGDALRDALDVRAEGDA